MADEDKRIVAQRHGLDFGMIQRTGNADIGFAIENHFQDLHRSARAQTDHHLGIRRLIILHHVGKKIGAHGKCRGNIQRAARGRLELVHGLARQGDIAQKLFGMGTEYFSSMGEREIAVRAGEEFHAERIFESMNTGAHGGLADAQSLGSAMESAVRDDGEEGFDLVNFHWRPPNAGF